MKIKCELHGEEYIGDCEECFKILRNRFKVMQYAMKKTMESDCCDFADYCRLEAAVTGETKGYPSLEKLIEEVE
jgi:ATP-dependent helicase/DNAse subunit B